MGYGLKWVGLVAAAMLLFAEIPGFFKEPWNLMSPAMAQSAADRKAEADRLLQQGIQQAQVSQFREALQSWEQALAIYREPSIRAAFPQASRRGEGAVLGNSGIAYKNLGNYQRAIEFHEQYLAIARELGDLRGEGNTLANLGNVYHNLGNYRQAITYHEQSLAIFREIDDRGAEGSVLGNLGLAYDNLGDHRQAVAYHEQSLAISREIKDRGGEGTTLGNLGSAFVNLGDYRQAITFHEQHLAIAREIEDRGSEGTALANLGIANHSLSDYRQAITYHEQSLVIFREIGTHSREGQALGNLGLTYNRLGDYRQALAYHEQSLVIFREIGARSGEASALGNLGLTHNRLGDYRQALAYHEQSLVIFREIADHRGEGRALGNLGLAYNRLGDYHQAISYHEQHRAVAHKIGDRGGEGNALANLGIVYRNMKQYDPALDFYRQALSIFSALGSRAEEGLALSNIGNLFNQQDQPELAIAFLKASVNVRESIRGDIRGLDTDLQQSFTDTVADTYRTLADLLLARGEILEVQRVLELLKVQELQEFTRSRVTNLETRDYELDPAEKTVIDAHSSLVAFGLKRSECAASPDCRDTATYRDLESQYTQLSTAYNQAVDQLMAQRRAEQEARARRADGQLLQAHQELSPRGFQGTAGMLTRDHPGTVLAYPVVLDDKLWVLWGSAGGAVSAIEVPAGRERIGNAVLRFRQLMTACELGGCDGRDIPAVQAVAQELYQYLIPAPLEDELQALQATLPEGQVPNLVIVPDLVTRYIPFAALHDGQQYLIEKYAISTLLSAEQTTTHNPLTTIDTTSILGLGLSNAVPEHGFLFPLENVEPELAAIVRTSATEPGIFRGEAHLNDDFDQEKLRLARRHRVLHIATHGVFNPRADALSFLMLGVGQPLYIRDLRIAQDYFQNLSLVVLSACETALSDIDQSGLELASIASTFLEARVDTVVASLWQVNDRATSDLMQQFYGSLAQSTPEQRVSVGQALRQAQLAMLYGNEATEVVARGTIDIETTAPRAGENNLPRTAHPYYWSPFTIIGNGL
jgi:CHAT domain-containing protein/Flp pilus assembly protein TadD